MSLLVGVLIGGVLAWFAAVALIQSKTPVPPVAIPQPPGQPMSVPGGSFPSDLLPHARVLAEYIKAAYDSQGIPMAEFNGSLQKAVRAIEHEAMRREVLERVSRRRAR